MDATKTGWRATPPALLLGLSIPILYAVFRVVLTTGWPPERGYSPRLILTGEGVGFACLVLTLAGTLELSRRVTGRIAQGVKLALAGVAIALCSDVVTGFVQFSEKAWDHQWVWKVYDYVGSGAWLVFAIGLTLAVSSARRVLGIVTVIFALLSWPPEPLREPLFGWMELERKSMYIVESAMRVVRYGLLLALTVSAARGVTTTDRYAAASGFRLSAKALWLRVIAAVAVVLLTLMMIGGKGGEGSLSLLRVAMMAQGVVGVIALVMFGAGALRAARAGIPELGSGFTLALGGAASLWAAGVSLAQLPHLYKMLYKKGEAGYWGTDSMDFTQALAIAMPVVVIVGVGLLATALSGYAARRGDEALRAEAQGKGIGFVALMLVAIAIQYWMLPKADSLGTFAMLSVLAATAGLFGTVLMAKLLGRGADTFEAEPGLPPASIVNAAT